MRTVRVHEDKILAQRAVLAPKKLRRVPDRKLRPRDKRGDGQDEERYSYEQRLPQNNDDRDREQRDADLAEGSQTDFPGEGISRRTTDTSRTTWHQSGRESRGQ